MISFTVQTVGGSEFRLAPEEADIQRVISDFTFDTQQPGGMHTGSFTIPRPAVLRNDEQLRWAIVTAYENGEPFYQGRVAQIGANGRQTVTLQLEGRINELSDDQTFREVYVLQDFAAWSRGATLTWQLAQAASGYMTSTGAPTVDANQPCLQQTCEGSWTSTSKPLVVNVFRSPVALSSIYYAWKKAAIVGATDPGWAWDVLAEPTEYFTGGYDNSINLRAAGPSSGTLNIGEANRNVRLAMYYLTGPAGNDGVQWSLYWTALALYGRHGLPKQGAGSLTEGPGLLQSDIVEDIVTRQAPRLNVDATKIDQNGVVVTSFAEMEDTTGLAALERVAKFGGSAGVINDWGADEFGDFYFLPPGSRGRTWRVRLDRELSLDGAGPATEDRWTGIKGNYRDPAGDTHSVGPAATEPEFVDESLADDDVNNPATGLGNRYYSHQLGVFTNPELAAAACRLKLAELNSVFWTGTFTISGTARTTQGEVMDAKRVQAGDYLIVEDDPDGFPHRIVTTHYDSTTGVVGGSVGRPPSHYDLFAAGLDEAERKAAV